jgi:signal transduction histidine kinase
MPSKFSDGKPVRVELLVREELTADRISVIDSGPGIADDQREIIFSAFQQGDNSVARKFGGVGLGLAIARAFAQLLNLDIVLTSELEKGSCFSIVFPEPTTKEDQ